MFRRGRFRACRIEQRVRELLAAVGLCFATLGPPSAPLPSATAATARVVTRERAPAVASGEPAHRRRAGPPRLHYQPVRPPDPLAASHAGRNTTATAAAALSIARTRIVSRAVTTRWNGATAP